MEDERGAPLLTPGRIALFVAGLAAAFAIGFGVSRSSNDGGSEAVAEAGSLQSIEQLEAQADAKPDSPEILQRLGLAYFEAGRFADAARAYERATRASPDDALLWSALGEALVMASERDPMPADALAAFQKAIALDPSDPRARYFLAVKRDLDGDHEGALADWLKLLEETPQDAPWREDLVRTIEQVGKINKIDVSARLAAAEAKSPEPVAPVAAQAIPGPTAQDLANASQIPPGEQQAMAEGMVARLETRLKNEPDDVNGWVMLMRSRMVLGEPAKARQALADAVKVNPARADFLKQQAETLGVK